jgi:hypothetical protein
LEKKEKEGYLLGGTMEGGADAGLGEEAGDVSAG